MAPARINPRLQEIPESATLAINQHSRALRAAGREIALFGFGESPFAVHAHMRKALADHAHEKKYLPTLGLPQLRRAISDYYRDVAGYDFPAACIAIAPGSKEVIYHLLMVLEGPLILPTPAWVSYKPQAQLLGKKTLFLPTDFATEYKLDIEHLEALLKSAAVAQSVMIVNSPNNPTGQAYSADEWEQIARLCRRHNVYVIADEIYAELNFADEEIVQAPSLGAHCPERVIVTSGLSKARAAGGWRLGFAAGCDASLQNVFDALTTVISETYSCVASPVQYAAIVAYTDAEVRQYVADCARLLQSVLDFTHRRLIDIGIRCLPARGGFYLYPDFSPFADLLQARGIHSAAALTRALLDEAGVALLPAEDFTGAAQSYACRLAAVDFDGDAVYQSYKKSGDTDLPAAYAEKMLPQIISGCDRLRTWLEKINT